MISGLVGLQLINGAYLFMNAPFEFILFFKNVVEGFQT